MAQTSFVLARCARNHGAFVIRFDGEGGNWIGNDAFRVGEEGGSARGYGHCRISGEIAFGPRYPGCPYCRATGISLCGKCNRPMCWDGRRSVTCEWCGAKNEVVGAVESLEGVADI